MRAAIYNPYLDSLGGGERYSMAVASVFARKGFSVDVEWKNPDIKEKLEERFGMKLDGINFIPDVKRGDDYDVCFWLSDGSIPTLRARKNFLHFQIPFHDVKGRTLLNRMKLFRINKIICNSFFTKKFIDKEYGVNSVVIYPPVDVERIRPKRKENLILFVGRFSQLKQAKRQDILVNAFKRFYDDGFDDWQLVLAGGAEVGAGEFVDKLKKMSKGYPIKIVKSPKFRDLAILYGQAKIFWSAVGFGAKEEKEPEKVEHFGISVVEAMAARAVPVVFKGGGYKEIVRQRENGFLWTSTTELLKFSRELIQTNGLMSIFAKLAKEDAGKFSYEIFEKSFTKLL